ncbi:MAG: hypothetical protein WA040_02645 [Anaerolineae bacterium]
MANRKQSAGACAYCGKEMTRGGLARHLRTCLQRQQAIATANARRGQDQTLYHLQVQDAWSSRYWLHLEMRGNATLEDLDHYLRAIWVECCGHLSAFEIGGTHYTQVFNDGMGYGEEKSMNVRVHRLFSPGMEIPYEYDFGTTTELLIKVVEQRQGKPTTKNPIVLMARNAFEPPPCAECGQPADFVCAECVWDDEANAVFCETHADEHEHDDMLMPIVNSPRTGMCGYDGPAEPPY